MKVIHTSCISEIKQVLAWQNQAPNTTLRAAVSSLFVCLFCVDILNTLHLYLLTTFFQAPLRHFKQQNLMYGCF